MRQFHTRLIAFVLVVALALACLPAALAQQTPATELLEAEYLTLLQNNGISIKDGNIMVETIEQFNAIRDYYVALCEQNEIEMACKEFVALALLMFNHETLADDIKASISNEIRPIRLFADPGLFSMADSFLSNLADFNNRHEQSAINIKGMIFNLHSRKAANVVEQDLLLIHRYLRENNQNGYIELEEKWAAYMNGNHVIAELKTLELSESFVFVLNYYFNAIHRLNKQYSAVKSKLFFSTLLNKCGTYNQYQTVIDSCPAIALFDTAYQALLRSNSIGDQNGNLMIETVAQFNAIRDHYLALCEQNEIATATKETVTLALVAFNYDGLSKEVLKDIHRELKAERELNMDTLNDAFAFLMDLAAFNCFAPDQPLFEVASPIPINGMILNGHARQAASMIHDELYRHITLYFPEGDFDSYLKDEDGWAAYVKDGSEKDWLLEHLKLPESFRFVLTYYFDCMDLLNEHYNLKHSKLWSSVFANLRDNANWQTILDAFPTE